MSNEVGFVEVLRKEGPSLLTTWLRTDDDLTLLIRRSVTQDTFRAFANLKRPPSSIFRAWAASRLEADALGGLLRVQNVLGFDRWLNELAHDLGGHWEREAGAPLRVGPNRKLVDLLLKAVVRWGGIASADRVRLIPLLHVPLDSFSLAALRPFGEDAEFGSNVRIPQRAQMGFVNTEELYGEIQDLCRTVAAKAGVPPICIDLLAFDKAHVNSTAG